MNEDRDLLIWIGHLEGMPPVRLAYLFRMSKANVLRIIRARENELARQKTNEELGDVARHLQEPELFV